MKHFGFLLALLGTLACSRGHGSEAKGASSQSPSSPAAEPAPATRPRDSASDRLLERFKGGDFEGVIELCQTQAQNEADDVRLWCTALVPAGLHALGRGDQGLDYSEQHCTSLPPADSSQARAAHIALMMIALSEAARYGNYEAEKPARDELLHSWLDACLVPPEQLEQVLHELGKPP